MKRRILVCLILLLVAGLPILALAESDEAPPLPERNPARVKAPVVTEPVLPGDAPTVAWSDAEVSAAKAKCTEVLAKVTLEFEPLPPLKEGLCGTPAPILLKSVGSNPKVEIDPPATVTCVLAVALHSWLKDKVQPGAKAELGAPVVKLHNATSYSCRNRYGGANTLLSEHALANALDISEFALASGERVTVLDSWPRVPAEPPLPLPNPVRVATASAETATVPPVSSSKRTGPNAVEVTKAKAEPTAPPTPPPVATPPPPKPMSERKSAFVRQAHEDACEAFGTVLGPEANEAHKNHFHFDMKKRRSIFCE